MVNKITNINYRRFLDSGEIEPITLEELIKALDCIKGKHIKEGRALLIALYYTGARPNEVLRLKPKDISKEGSYILIKLQGSKGGISRTVRLRYQLDLVKEFYKYAMGLFEDIFLFYDYRGQYTRKVLTQKGYKLRVDITQKLYYYIKKWFKDIRPDSINPYFLRHNRFSKLSMAGATAEEIRILKGAKNINSVTPYLHLSPDTSKKIAKKIN